MKTDPDVLTVSDLLSCKAKNQLGANPEYQRGNVWSLAQKRRLVDSVFRGYPIPLIYLHYISESAGKYTTANFEIIDGQQRINALSEFCEGQFKLFNPQADEAEARFPEFIKRQPCPWGGCRFSDLSETLKDQFLTTPLRIAIIETDDVNEARDLFVRLQAGLPLNSQEKRDAWPGQFTDFILRLGGKPLISRYPGHRFFNEVMRAQRSNDRGRFRQLAAQITMLFFCRRAKQGFCDISNQAIDDYYYENLGFDAGQQDAARLIEILDKLADIFSDQKRSRIIGHEAIHLVLLVDSLWDDYTRSWEDTLATAFDSFRVEFSKGKLTHQDANPSEYWLRYGLLTRASSDRADSIQRRHEFFVSKMREHLGLQPKDPQRLFGPLEREIIYHRDKKRCAVCKAEVLWPDVQIHHVIEHSKGGATCLDNGALVHKKCHPKGAAALEFALRWRSNVPTSDVVADPLAPLEFPYELDEDGDTEAFEV